MSKEGEIPGFYRDPKTGKYFRERPNDTGNPSLKKLKATREMEHENKQTIPDVTTVVGYLRKREVGRLGGVNSEKEYFQVKTHGKKQIFNGGLRCVNTYNVLSVDFLKGDEKSVFGMWSVQNKDGVFHYVVGEEHYYNTPINPETAPYRMCRNIADLCRGTSNIILNVYNIPDKPDAPKDPALLEFLNSSQDRPFNPLKHGPLYCCCALKSEVKFVVGGNGFIRYFNRFAFDSDVPMKGRICTLSADEPSKVLISGTHHGMVSIHDFRTKEPEAYIKISSKAINDSFFYDQNKLMLMDVEGMFVKVDLRMQAVVRNYYGHKHSVTKRPFNVVNNLVCASGADNVIRIWHISGGHPIHEIRPLENAGSNIRGWLNGDANETFLNYFEGPYKKIFKI